MPMSFPTMQSLKDRAQQRGFRQPLDDEEEHVYRSAFADFMVSVDRVESGEIRSKDGLYSKDPASQLAAMGFNVEGLLRGLQ